MIAELLTEGANNAKTGKELAAIYNCDIRNITEQIEKERRNGRPICASAGTNAGYYLAANEEELAEYCEKLRHRAGELFKTRAAMLAVLEEIRNKKEQEAGINAE